MKKILDEHLIWGICILMLFHHFAGLELVAYVLAGLIYTELSIYFEDKRKQLILAGIFVAIGIFFRGMVCFVPLILYQVGWFCCWKGAMVGLLYFVCLEQFTEPWHTVLWVLASLLALRMGYQSSELSKEQAQLVRLKDAQTEFAISARMRTKELLEKQDYEVQMATLQERNRIAREIHDNVGHMLSRTILQTGALLTIYKEEPLHAHLDSINQSLNEAMNNIRESVHDLHDESIDLRARLLEIMNQMKEHYEVSFEYDMTAGAPRNVKYCFLSTVKEAMTNIEKHSNASKILVVLREHPGFYQMMIEDNGTQKEQQQEPGIGLLNMKERVDSLNGTIHFSKRKGFRIMMTIPKEGEQE